MRCALLLDLQIWSFIPTKNFLCRYWSSSIWSFQKIFCRLLIVVPVWYPTTYRGTKFSRILYSTDGGSNTYPPGAVPVLYYCTVNTTVQQELYCTIQYSTRLDRRETDFFERQKNDIAEEKNEWIINTIDDDRSSIMPWHNQKYQYFHTIILVTCLLFIPAVLKLSPQRDNGTIIKVHDICFIDT